MGPGQWPTSLLTWAPMAIAIPGCLIWVGATVETFWRSNSELMQGVILSVSVGYLFLLLFEKLCRTHPLGLRRWCDRLGGAR